MHIPIRHFGPVGDVSLSTLLAGGTVYALQRFTVRWTVELLERERVTVWGQVPAKFSMRLAPPDLDTFDLSSVSTVFSSGSAIPAETACGLSRLGATLSTGYGGTEMSGPVSLSGPDASLAELCETVGVPLAQLEVAIFTGDGRHAGEGTVGEVCVRGACVFAGYHSDPEASVAVLDRDGWYHSGDLGLVDSGGRFRLAGRPGDGFRSGGVTAYPREIELSSSSAPRSPLASWMWPTRCSNTSRAASWWLPEGPNQTPTSCRSTARTPINYKVPRTVGVLDELPTRAVGRIDRAALRQSTQATVQQHPKRLLVIPDAIAESHPIEGDTIDDS